MFFWVSTRLVGQVDRVDDTVIFTKFIHINGMPFAPDGAFVQHTPAGASEPVVAQIPLVGRSVAAGYLPRWGLVVGAMIALIGFFVAAELEAPSYCAVALLAGVGIATTAWRVASRLGRISRDEADRRRVYGAWIGPAIDPILCGRQLEPWIERLRGFVAGHARGSETSGYRSSPETRKAWFDAALGSDDIAVWGAAFTLARAEMALAADRSELATLTGWHAALWARLSPRIDEARAVPGVSRIAEALPIPGKQIAAKPSPFSSGRFWIPIAVASVLGILSIAAYDYSHPAFIALNVSGHQQIVVLVDGQPMGPPIVNAASSRGYAQSHIGPGQHTFEARDAATGEAIDRTTFDAGWVRRAVLYAPSRRPGSCIVWARAVYGERMLDKVLWPPARLVLDPSLSAWGLPSRPEHVLEALPEVIHAQNDSWTETRSVVDVIRCPPPGEM